MIYTKVRKSGELEVWEETTLSCISKDISYGYTESASSFKIGPHFLRITDIQNGIVDWDTVPYCKIDDQKKQKYILEDGDIVVARTGNSTGENYLFRTKKECVFASYLIRFKIDKKRANPYYVWYTMRSDSWWDFVSSSKSGSAQAGANAKVLGMFRLPLPPLREQQAIAHILRTLDDKIELNRRQNTTLEAMAQAIFKDWFVDFGPVRAKMEGRQPEGMSPEVAYLFPNRLDDEGKPEGWKITSLYELAKFINGAAYKNFSFSDQREGLPIVKIAELKNGITEQTKFTRETLDQKYKISNEDMLFSWSGNPDTSIDIFIWVKGEAWLNQHIFKVITNKNQKYFIYYYLKKLKPLFADIARNKQTTGLGHVTVKDLQKILIHLPDDTVINKFNIIIQPIFNKCLLNLKQIENITLVRDTLLPKLISGELRVPDAEKRVTDLL